MFLSSSSILCTCRLLNSFLSASDAVDDKLLHPTTSQPLAGTVSVAAVSETSGDWTLQSRISGELKKTPLFSRLEGGPGDWLGEESRRSSSVEVTPFGRHLCRAKPARRGGGWLGGSNGGSSGNDAGRVCCRGTDRGAIMVLLLRWRPR